MKKRLNSRAKGARIEREAAKFLTGLGFRAARNARNGLSAADLDCNECPVLSKIWLEIKGDESIDLDTKALDDAMSQACDGAWNGSAGWKPYAVLWHRKRKGWRLTFLANRIQVTTAGPDRIKTALLHLSQREQ